MVLLWIKILLIALAVAGLGYMIYSMVKGSGPPSKPPSDCAHQKGSSANADSGCGNTGISLGCCPVAKPKCCSLPDGSKKCYDPTKSACTKTGVCPISNVCPSVTGDKATCCGIGKNKGNNKCDPTSGTCIACKELINPPCGGKNLGGGNITPPTCCPKKDCYVSGEDQSSSNPCVCCGGDPNGYGGKCCSKGRCLKKKKTDDYMCCPEVGQVLDENDTCCLPEKIIKGICCADNKICFSRVDTTKEQPVATCCQAESCHESSFCYSDPMNEITLPTGSPLSGMCAGPPGEKGTHNMFCVNSNDWGGSSFALCSSKSPCAKTSEQCTTLSYYPLPTNASGPQPGVCEIPPGTTKGTCLGGANDGKSCTKASDCGPAVSTPGKCGSNAQCPGSGLSKNVLHGKSCYDFTSKTYVPAKADGTCDASKNEFPVGSCSTPCPVDNPTTYCPMEGPNQCLVYDNRDADGKPVETGFCSSGKGCSHGDVTFNPGGTKTASDSFATKKICQDWCETLRGGECIKKDSSYECSLPFCSETPADQGQKDYITGQQGEATPTREGAFNMEDCDPGFCYTYFNVPGVSQITYDVNDSTATCRAIYDCAGHNEKGVLLDPGEGKGGFRENVLYFWDSSGKSSPTTRAELLYATAGAQTCLPEGICQWTSTSTKQQCKNDTDCYNEQSGYWKNIKADPVEAGNFLTNTCLDEQANWTSGAYCPEGTCSNTGVCPTAGVY